MSHVDTTSPITHISLCAGYGGIDIGLQRAVGNLRTIAFSEIEAFACANLVSKMEAGLLDSAPIWTNLKTFPWGKFRGVVDILSGGYPCQPFSAAGKRLGTEDPRHLWPYIADGIAAMRPSVCFFENVEGHISLGLPDVIEDLGRLGYRTTWGIFSASEVGAPHQRKRVFIMAHLINEGSQGRLRGWTDQEREGLNGHAGCGSASLLGRWPSRPGQPQFSWEPPRVVAQYENKGDVWWQWGESHADEESGENRRHKDVQRWQAEPSLGGDPDGPSCGVGHAELYLSCDNRTDELRLLGNGVVPATAELAWRTLWKELTA